MLQHTGRSLAYLFITRCLGSDFHKYFSYPNAIPLVQSCLALRRGVASARYLKLHFNQSDFVTIELGRRVSLCRYIVDDVNVSGVITVVVSVSGLPVGWYLDERVHKQLHVHRRYLRFEFSRGRTRVSESR